MPRIQPVPWEYLSDDVRREIEEGRTAGRSSGTSGAAQVMAYSTAAFWAMKQSAKTLFRNGVIEPRLQELLRLRSANLNQCGPCAAARKEATVVSEEDAACLTSDDFKGMSKRERLALAFLDKMSTDHLSIDDATFRELAQEFSTAEIVELGWRCGTLIGAHRFMHSMDMLGTDAPLFPFDPSDIDRTTAPGTTPAPIKRAS